MRHRTTWPMMFIIGVVTVFSVLVIWPGYPKMYLPDFIDYPQGPLADDVLNFVGLGKLHNQSMRLGLDLKGGTYLLSEANLAALPPDRNPDAAMDDARTVIESRVNTFGVSETEVTREGRNRIAVQIPGVSPEQARLIVSTSQLNFREPEIDKTNANVVCVTSDATRFEIPAASLTRGTDSSGNTVVSCTGSQSQTGTLVWKPATGTVSGATRALNGANVNDAQYQITQAQGDSVAITFDGEGSLLFDQITQRLQPSYPLGIFLDSKLISAPTVQTRISNGQTVITGLTTDQAKNLATLIRGGALPISLTVIQAQEVDATLGEKTLVRGVQAGLIGIMAVMAFMVLYYRLPGVLASLALFTYISVVMMIFKLGPLIGPVTITMAGIAGFVLSVGMAVDANILVFERLKEELRAGRNLAQAVEHGFDRAWSSIRDSNVSTLITCGILWWFGDQFNAALVKGFAITLAIGVLISLFSAITVTRTFLRALVTVPFLSKNTHLFAPDLRPAVKTARPFAFDFVKKRGFYFLLSAVILVPGMISLAIPPHLNTGIEFSSGATFTLDFANNAVTQDQVKGALKELGHGEARVQKTSDGTFIIRTDQLNVPAGPPLGPTPPSARDTLEAGIKSRLGDFKTLNFNQVSEIIASSIVYKAIVAILFAAAAILVYITWSFRNIPQSYRYGIAAVVAALHDAGFVLGAFAILGHVFGTEIDSLFITGVLTVIGFSVHDTIVVFDRIRENVATNPGVRFDEVVNASLTETLARSINTSGTVVLTIIALLVLGAGSIHVLLLTLLIGIISGTYSSIFIASQILVSWEDGDFDAFFDTIAFWRRRGGDDEMTPVAASTRTEALPGG